MSCTTKKVHVDPYTKPSTGQNVRGYVRTDPRSREPHTKELPPEEPPSFLSGGKQEQEEKEEPEKEEGDNID